MKYMALYYLNYFDVPAIKFKIYEIPHLEYLFSQFTMLNWPYFRRKTCENLQGSLVSRGRGF